MAEPRVNLTAKDIKKRDSRLRILKILLLVICVFLIILYVVLKFIYDVGSFTVTLDSSYNLEGSLVIYENIEQKLCLKELKAEENEFMTNTSGDWIPKDIQDGPDGSHNGDNYIAYTFYAEKDNNEK